MSIKFHYEDTVLFFIVIVNILIHLNLKVAKINIPKLYKILYSFRDNSGMNYKKYNLELFSL